MKLNRLLPTTVIGSYSRPKWLDLAILNHKKGLLTEQELKDAFDNAVRSAIHDQELAGIDYISDGELRRETMVYFYSRNIHGFQFDGKLRAIGNLDSHIRMPDPVIVSKVRRKKIPMAEHFTFLRDHCIRSAPKVCSTGPHMIAKRAENRAYKTDRELVFDLADIINAELKRVEAQGCRYIQIDEPVWIGYPDEMDWCVEAFNRTVRGLKSFIAVHVCFGNYLGKQLFHGKLESLFPAILGVKAHALSFEYARLGFWQLDVFKKHKWRGHLCAGVVDVKNNTTETPQLVAKRIRKLLEYFPADKLILAPDCGLKFRPRALAFGKLKALAEGTALVREKL
jgi:5-methyltetrahydropteroyltriglutamate--homocysteine methyltransferase